MRTATTALNFRVLPSRRGETCTSRDHFDRNDCWSRGTSTPNREAQGGPGRMVHPRRPRAPLTSQHVRRLHVGPAHALQVRRSQGQLKVAKCERTRAFHLSTEAIKSTPADPRPSTRGGLSGSERASLSDMVVPAATCRRPLPDASREKCGAW